MSHRPLILPAILSLCLCVVSACGQVPSPRPDESMDGGAGGAGEMNGEGERDMAAGAPADAAMPADGAPAGDGAVAVYPLDGRTVALVLVLGDSVAAGYNAAGQNRPGGRGYARLLFNNHADFPAYNGHDLATRYPGAAFRDLSISGATSDKVLSDLRGRLSGLPASVAGDVLVLFNVGGNDFKNRPNAMINEVEARALAREIRANIAEIYRLLKGRYAVAGKAAIFLQDNIHDPSDGVGTIPLSFMDGFCKALHLAVLFKMQVLANLALLNGEIAAEVRAQGGHLADIHGAFLGHGMNGGAARFLDNDCVHPLNAGHDLIRKVGWQVLTGERY